MLIAFIEIIYKRKQRYYLSIEKDLTLLDYYVETPLIN